MKKKMLATQALHQCFLLSASLLWMQQKYHAHFLFCHVELKEHVNECLKFNKIKFSFFIKDLREIGFFFSSEYAQLQYSELPKQLGATASICAKMPLFCIISASMIWEKRQITSQYFYENIFYLWSSLLSQGLRGIPKAPLTTLGDLLVQRKDLIVRRLKFKACPRLFLMTVYFICHNFSFL